MSGQSIFGGVLHRETSFTAMLANLLRREEELCLKIYDFMTGITPSGVYVVTAQSSGDEGERPDIKLLFREKDVDDIVIEVKVRASLGPTESQKESKGDYKNAHWLAPRKWYDQHTLHLPKERRHTLEDLGRYLRDRIPIVDSEVVREFITYLELAFPTIRFEPEEREVMQDISSFASASIKLHQIIDAVAERLLEFPPNRQTYEVKPEMNSEEYGYYIKKRGRQNGYLLWFGIWPHNNCLLGIGYESHWHPDIRPEGFVLTDDEAWVLTKMNDIILADDPVQEMYDKLLTTIAIISS